LEITFIPAIEPITDTLIDPIQHRLQIIHFLTKNAIFVISRLQQLFCLNYVLQTLLIQSIQQVIAYLDVRTVSADHYVQVHININIKVEYLAVYVIVYQLDIFQTLIIEYDLQTQCVLVLEIQLILYTGRQIRTLLQKWLLIIAVQTNHYIIDYFPIQNELSFSRILVYLDR